MSEPVEVSYTCFGTTSDWFAMVCAEEFEWLDQNRARLMHVDDEFPGAQLMTMLATFAASSIRVSFEGKPGDPRKFGEATYIGTVHFPSGVRLEVIVKLGSQEARRIIVSGPPEQVDAFKAHRTNFLWYSGRLVGEG